MREPPGTTAKVKEMFENLKNLKSESLSTNLSREQLGCKEDKDCLKIKKTEKIYAFQQIYQGNHLAAKKSGVLPPVWSRQSTRAPLCSRRSLFSKICYHLTKTEEFSLMLVNNARNLFRYKQKAMQIRRN